MLLSYFSQPPVPPRTTAFVVHEEIQESELSRPIRCAANRSPWVCVVAKKQGCVRRTPWTNQVAWRCRHLNHTVMPPSQHAGDLQSVLLSVGKETMGSVKGTYLGICPQFAHLTVGFILSTAFELLSCVRLTTSNNDSSAWMKIAIALALSFSFQARQSTREDRAQAHDMPISYR